MELITLKFNQFVNCRDILEKICNVDDYFVAKIRNYNLKLTITNGVYQCFASKYHKEIVVFNKKYITNGEINMDDVKYVIPRFFSFEINNKYYCINSEDKLCDSKRQTLQEIIKLSGDNSIANGSYSKGDIYYNTDSFYCLVNLPSNNIQFINSKLYYISTKNNEIQKIKEYIIYEDELSDNNWYYFHEYNLYPQEVKLNIFIITNKINELLTLDEEYQFDNKKLALTNKWIELYQKIKIFLWMVRDLLPNELIYIILQNLN